MKASRCLRIVVTVKFEGIAREPTTAKLSVRDPKIAAIRPDKAAGEADTLEDIHRLHLAERIGWPPFRVAIGSGLREDPRGLRPLTW